MRRKGVCESEVSALVYANFGSRRLTGGSPKKHAIINSGSADAFKNEQADGQLCNVTRNHTKPTRQLTEVPVTVRL